MSSRDDLLMRIALAVLAFVVVLIPVVRCIQGEGVFAPPDGIDGPASGPNAGAGASTEAEAGDSGVGDDSSDAADEPVSKKSPIPLSTRAQLRCRDDRRPTSNDRTYAVTNTVAQRALRIRTTPKRTETTSTGDENWCNLQSHL